MKKHFKFRYVLLSLVSLYIFIILFCRLTSEGRVLYDPFRIEYKGETYVETSCGVDVDEPYALVNTWDIEESSKRYYIKGTIFEDLFTPFLYFEKYCETYDKYNNFISIPRYDEVLVKESFVYPTIHKNEIDEVWMSHSCTDGDNIKDKSTVDKIVECAKSDGEIPLDKDIVEYIKEHSVDGHCLNLKYKGYPLVEKVYIEETEDGRYIIKQYTIEEFDTIYYQDEAHQD